MPCRAGAREWDIERLLETNAAAVTLASLGLGLVVSRKFFVLPFVVAGFLMQHAVQGWCPRVGYRAPTGNQRRRRHPGLAGAGPCGKPQILCPALCGCRLFDAACRAGLVPASGISSAYWKPTPPPSPWPRWGWALW